MKCASIYRVLLHLQSITPCRKPLKYKEIDWFGDVLCNALFQFSLIKMAETRTPKCSNPFTSWVKYLRRDSDSNDINNNITNSVDEIVDFIQPEFRTNTSFLRSLFSPRVLLETMPCLSRDNRFLVTYHHRESVRELFYYDSVIVTPSSEPFILNDIEAARETTSVWRYTLDTTGRATFRGSTTYCDKFNYTSVRYPDIRSAYI